MTQQTKPTIGIGIYRRRDKTAALEVSAMFGDDGGVFKTPDGINQ